MDAGGAWRGGGRIGDGDLDGPAAPCCARPGRAGGSARDIRGAPGALGPAEVPPPTLSSATSGVRLVAEILVLWHELARDECRALWVADNGHPDPGGVERRDDHLSAELGGLRG